MELGNRAWRMHAYFILFTVAIFLCGSCSSVDGRKAETTLPNILWIVADDLGTDLACYGTPAVQTQILTNLPINGLTRPIAVYIPNPKLKSRLRQR